MEANRIYNAQKSLTVAKLPLDDAKTECSIVLKINSVNDTLNIWYSSFPHLISKECGYTFYHNLDSVRTTNHLISSVSIINKSITTSIAENIRIYY